MTLADLDANAANSVTYDKCLADSKCDVLLRKLASFNGEEFSRLKMR